MDAAKAREVKDILEKLIDKSKDSLRFYYLGNNYKGKVEHIGAKASFDMEGLLTL
jgi:CRISPR-associated protein Cas2